MGRPKPRPPRRLPCHLAGHRPRPRPPFPTRSSPPPRPRSHPRRSLLFSARRSTAAGDLNDYRYECGGTACYLTGLVDIGLVERRLIEGARGNAVVRCFAPPFDGGNMTCSFSRTCSRRRLGLGVHAYACLTMSLAFRRLARDDFCPMRPSPSPWGLFPRDAGLCRPGFQRRASRAFAIHSTFSVWPASAARRAARPAPATSFPRQPSCASTSPPAYRSKARLVCSALMSCAVEARRTPTKFAWSRRSCFLTHAPPCARTPHPLDCDLYR